MLIIQHKRITFTTDNFTLNYSKCLHCIEHNLKRFFCTFPLESDVVKCLDISITVLKTANNLA